MTLPRREYVPAACGFLDRGMNEDARPREPVIDRAGIAQGTNPADPAGRRSLPAGMSGAEAELILDIVARVKARRFGRLVVVVSDGRLVDVEIVEKMDRRMLGDL
jgi:hypothetical protein